MEGCSLIDIVVPVYNEGKNIEQLFDRISKDIKTDINLIVVYDFDEDDTVPEVIKLKNNYRFEIKLEKNIYGRGALNAMKTGFQKSTSDIVLVVMADLSDSLEIVDKMYDKINYGFDIVCGSRYMKDGKQIGGPLLKRIFSRIAGVSLHYLIRIPTHDVTNSFKMYSRKVLENIQIESNGGFEIGMEITIKAYIKGYKVTEIPSSWQDRENGESKFQMWKWMPKYIKWYLLGIRGIWFNRKGNF